MDVLEILKEKFTSGNDIPVSRATITREEYEALCLILINYKPHNYAPYTPIQKVEVDPCPNCRIGCVCRTTACGRLSLPKEHPFRTTNTSVLFNCVKG